MSANISGSLGSFDMPAAGCATGSGSGDATRLGFVSLTIFALDQHALADGGSDQQCALDAAYRT